MEMLLPLSGPMGPQLLTLPNHSAISGRHLVLLQAFHAEDHFACLKTHFAYLNKKYV